MAKTLKQIRIDDELIKKIEKRAEKEGRNFSNLVHHILDQHFKKNKEQE